MHLLLEEVFGRQHKLLFQNFKQFMNKIIEKSEDEDGEAVYR